MSTIKQSETIIIKRSQINFAPYNPKHHTEDAIKQQKKNFKKVGFLGGIVWNKTTGNLVSGHKRVMAFDLEYKYDGTPEKDYDIKVEMVEMDLKTEKEQNIYMDAKSSNTAQDLELLAELIPEIDFKEAGLTVEDIQLIEFQVPTFSGNSIELKESIETVQKPMEDQKQKIKDLKKQMRGNVAQMREDTFNESDTYVILSFDSHDNKAEFMERFGYAPELNTIKGEVFSDKVERID